MSLIQIITCLVLLTGLVSSVDLNWLNEEISGLENVFKEMTENEQKLKGIWTGHDNSDVSVSIESKQDLYQVHSKFTLFLTQINELVTRSNELTKSNLYHKYTDFKYKNEYKEQVRDIFQRLWFAIDLLKNRVKFLDQNPDSKGFYEQDLADASQLSSLLERTKNRFLRHVETIYYLKDAYEAVDGDLDYISDLYDVVIENKDYINLIKTAVYQAKRLEEKYLDSSDKKKSTPKSDIEWLYEIDPEIDKELQTLFGKNIEFIQDIFAWKSLNKYYRKLFEFLTNIRNEMRLLDPDHPQTLFPFTGEMHMKKIVIKTYYYEVVTKNEVGFKQQSKRCHQRLTAIMQWIQEKVSFLEANSVLRFNYKKGIDEMGRLLSDVSDSRGKLEDYLKTVYEIVAKSRVKSNNKKDPKELFRNALENSELFSHYESIVNRLSKLIWTY